MTEDAQHICYNFVVHDRPCAVWSLDLQAENQTFLDGIDHSYFTALVDSQVPLLDSEATRMNAALAIRLTYGHALETFFGLVGAMIQAPHCPLGWILTYKPDELRSVLEDVTATRLEFSRIPGPVTWEVVSETIHRRLPPDQDALKALFASLWRRLAADYVAELKIEEYNSLKHGLRVTAGGFSLALGNETDAAPVLDSRSTFGCRFPSRNKLDRYNFSIENAGVNWNPIALAARVEFLSISINNVLCFLKEQCATEDTVIRLLWPAGPADAWDMPWHADFIIEQMRGGRVFSKEDVCLRMRDDILSTYEPQWRGRRTTVR